MSVERICTYTPCYQPQCRQLAAPGEVDRCEPHAGKMCSCGMRATHECNYEMQLGVCGRPVCDRCTNGKGCPAHAEVSDYYRAAMVRRKATAEDGSVAEVPSIVELAAAAYSEHQAAVRVKQIEEQNAATCSVQVAYADARLLLERSPLPQWFPGADWEVYEVAEEHGSWFGARGMGAVVCSGRPEGTDPDYAGTPVFALAEGRDSEPVTADRGKVMVFLVQSVAGTGDAVGYSHWAGPQVRSLADIGEALARREANTRTKESG